MIATLNHPHICQLYDVGPNYLVMEYIEGAPLKGRCRWIEPSNTPHRSWMPWMPHTRRGSLIAT